MRHVGTDLERPDGPAKVSGRALYIADVDVPEAWIGGTVRSPLARGVLHGFERDPRFDFSRVVVVGPEHIPGENVQALIVDDQPVLATREIRHFGEPLLLVAAPDRVTLLAALAAIRPRIEARAAELDFERSTHVQKSISIDKGDVEHAFAHAPLGSRVFEGEYRTDSQEQLYIEPQGAIAWPAARDGSVRVEGSLQCPHYVRKALARCLGIAPELARVVQRETGGGFGGKEDYPSVVACHAALLSRASERPVKLIYERHEDLLVTPKRHPSRVRHRTLVASDGALLAMDIDVLLDGGAYTTLSPVVLSRGCIHAAGPYRCANVRIRGRVVATDHVPYGAFRGFGAPQTCFAIERQMDRIARGLRVHPAALRRKNQLLLGDSTATGQVLKSSVGSTEVLDDALARSGFERHAWCASAPASADATTSSGKRRGLGLSFFFHGAGFTGSGEEMLKGRVRVALLDDGRVEVLAGSTEIGQGTNTLFTAIAAESLGAELSDVVLATPDTARVPDSGPTVASRTCMVVGGCLAQACRELAQRIGMRAGDSSSNFRALARAHVARGGERSASATYTSPAGLQWSDATYSGDAYPVYGWACDVAEVEVDLDTFEVEVKHFWTTVDVGKALQPRLVEGQIEGGSLQAIGWAQLEVITMKDGRCEQDRMATCIIPTTLDTPPIDVKLVEIPYPHGPYGAKGVGELPMDGGAPAVVSAIEDALGVHLTHLSSKPGWKHGEVTRELATLAARVRSDDRLALHGERCRAPRRDSSAAAPARRAARRSAPHRLEGRLRRRRMRRVHRAARRRSRAVLSRAVLPGTRERGAHRRGTRARDDPRSVPRRRRSAVRHLHAGHDHDDACVDRRVSPRATRADDRGRARGARRQSLPLHGLRQDPRRSRARGAREPGDALPVKVVCARTLDEALDALQGADATTRILAGGTDLMVELENGRAQPARVVDVWRVAALRYEREEHGGLRLGALTTCSDLVHSPRVAALADILAASAREVGATQIQNRATLGGNLGTASPAADLNPVLLALDARVRLVSRRAERELALEDFLTGYRTSARAHDELIESIFVPARDPRERRAFRKVGTRRAQSIAKLVVALAVVRDGEGRGARIVRLRAAAGSLAERTLLLPTLARELEGRVPDAPAIERAVRACAANDVRPRDDVRSSARYRRTVFERVLVRLLDSA